MKKIRVLVVEDSLTVRKYLVECLRADPEIDVKGKMATVRADRILIVSGIRAAQAISLQIGFSVGERTTANPGGIYITSEKLQASE